MMNVGDEFIFKEDAIHCASYYTEQGIPSKIGGFRGKIVFLEENKARMGFQVYWKNKLVINDYGAHKACWCSTEEIERMIDGNE